MGFSFKASLEAGRAKEEVEGIVRAVGDGVAEWTSEILNKGLSPSDTVGEETRRRT